MLYTFVSHTVKVNFFFSFIGWEVQCDCSESPLAIQGGNYTLTKNLESGTLLIYQCADGYYPYPTITRRCRSNGHWSPPPSRFNQICKREWDKHPMISFFLLLCLEINPDFLCCSRWMPWPKCLGVWKCFPISRKIHSRLQHQVWVLPRIHSTRFLQSYLLIKREMEWLYSHL